MFELRWINRPVPHYGLEGHYLEKVLQYRTFSMPNCINPISWSDWQDVPVVQE